MAFTTLVVPGGVGFSPGSSEAAKPKVLANEFGDGYVQRVADGLNSDLSTLSVRFDVLRQSEGEFLWNFFRDRYGVIPFKFAVPGSPTLRKWIATDYNREWQGATIVAVSATWKEVVDPE